MARKMVDCREVPSESGCTLMVAGEEEEVLNVATRHAIMEHGHPDTPELREKIRTALKDAKEEPSAKPSGTQAA